MKQAQKGFTLIELVMVIVIIGILSAVAVPKFIDLQVDARDAAAKGIAGAMASGSAINYGAKKVGNAAAVAISAANVCTAALLGPLAPGFTYADGTAAAAAAGTAGQYTVLNTTTQACNGAADDGATKTCNIMANGSASAASVPVSVVCAK